MATVKEQVQQIYVGLLGRAADKEGLDYWVGQIESGTMSIEEVRSNAVNEQPEGQDIFDSGKTREEIVATLYENLFERAPGANADYWVNGDGAGVNADQLVLALINGAGTSDAQVLANKVEAAQYYTENAGTSGEEFRDDARAAVEDVDGTAASVDASKSATDALDQEPEEPTEPSVPGDTITLTEGRDVLTGTDNDDTFYGDVGQNQLGAISNAFSTGDFLDGGAGRDKLVASINDDQMVDGGGTYSMINGRTVNVEEAYFEAQSNITGPDTIGTVKVDAGRMDSVDQFWSNNSSADLVIDDVRLGSKLSITKDITFGLRDADVNAGLEAYFDTNSLTNEGSFKVNSSLLIRAADVSTETPDTPLANVELEIGFTVGGEVVSITVQSTDGTYAGLRSAIETALAANGQSDLNVTLGEAYNEVVFAGNTTTLGFTAQEILITDPNGEEFADVNFQTSNISPVDGGFLLAGNAAPQDPSTSSTFIESNLILDNAGRGSTAGDVVIGGMSGSGKVVEKLNLTVDRNSKIGDLMTGYNRGDQERAFQQIIVDSAEAQGDVVIGDVGNVFNFDATAFAGENLEVSGSAGTDDIGSTAPDMNPFAYNTAFVYNTGSSNDTINLSYSHEKAAEFANYSLSINTGAGDDNVTLRSTGADDLNLPDQRDLANVVINTGSGDDVVRTPGAGAVTISTGSGNDTIYTDNTGKQTTGLVGVDTAHWVFNNDTATDDNDLGELRGFTAQNLGFMPKASLQVTFAGAQENGAGGVTAALADYLTNGFESTVKIDAGADYLVSRAEINAAVKEAINEDAVLSKLLVAVDGPNNTLVIRSLIDGRFEADDLQFNIVNDATDFTLLSQNEQNQLLAAYQAIVQDSDATLADAQAANAATVATADGVNPAQAGDGPLVAATPGTAATATVDTATMTFGGTETQALTGGLTLPAAVYADAGALATAIAGLPEVATATVSGGIITVTFVVAPNGGANPAVAFDVQDSAGGGTTITAAPTAGTAGTPGSGTEIDGRDSAADNTGNVIDAGSGNDVIVLSTNENSNETVEFNDSFGKVTIVNFEDTVTAGLDTLDFTSYLTTNERTSDSTSGVSQQRIATTADGNTSAAANEVSVVNFTYDQTQNSGANTFASLTGSDLLKALNGDGNYGNLVGSSLVSENAATNFGTTTGDIAGVSQTHLVMVENQANLGEYKVFQLTSVSDAGTSVDNGDFATATLVGTVDFGGSIDVTTVDLA